MEVTIDKFGRILIPKKVRELLHLEAGQALNFKIENNQILLRKKAQVDVIVTTSELGLPVIHTAKQDVEHIDILASIRETRAEYLDRKAKLK